MNEPVLHDLRQCAAPSGVRLTEDEQRLNTATGAQSEIAQFAIATVEESSNPVFKPGDRILYHRVMAFEMGAFGPIAGEPEPHEEGCTGAGSLTHFPLL